MTGDVMVVLLVGLAVMAWLCLFKIIPNCNVSTLRYRLWKLRDDTVDDILAGRIRDAEEARYFIDELEAAIAHAPAFSLVNMAAMKRLCGSRKFETKRRLNIERLRGSDKAILAPRIKEYEWALLRHSLVGTPSGWAVLLFFAPLIFLMVLGHRVLHIASRTGAEVYPILKETRWTIRRKADHEYHGVGPALAALEYRQTRRQRRMSSFG